ncbi:serine acetyltransferase [Trifolium pratense]|uniref:Serine acetyltransferase n=1 Tax=Trifolium pratense TaxID=57577 RepID=A0A2K3L217_TRIPR|nr:serine acetyltransferase 3, mitochondrial-like [Trifolium pratense]PNX72569.1 serine acetyltransferase [Trifolium pratense]
MQEEAKIDVTVEPILSSYYHVSILSQKSLETAFANHLSVKLSSVSLPSTTLSDLFVGVFESDKEIMDAMKNDLIAVKERDPACISHVHCFLIVSSLLCATSCCKSCSILASSDCKRCSSSITNSMAPSA